MSNLEGIAKSCICITRKKILGYYQDGHLVNWFCPERIPSAQVVGKKHHQTHETLTAALKWLRTEIQLFIFTVSRTIMKWYTVTYKRVNPLQSNLISCVSTGLITIRQLCRTHWTDSGSCVFEPCMALLGTGTPGCPSVPTTSLRNYSSTHPHPVMNTLSEWT